MRRELGLALRLARRGLGLDHVDLWPLVGVCLCELEALPAGTGAGESKCSAASVCQRRNSMFPVIFSIDVTDSIDDEFGEGCVTNSRLCVKAGVFPKPWSCFPNARMVLWHSARAAAAISRSCRSCLIASLIKTWKKSARKFLESSAPVKHQVWGVLYSPVGLHHNVFILSPINETTSWGLLSV